MPRLKFDDIKQLAEPIIIEAGILGKEEYKIESITTDMLQKLNELTPKDMPKEKLPIDTPLKQLALITGKEADHFKGLDLRIVGKVLKFVMDTINEGIETKNPSGAGASS